MIPRGAIASRLMSNYGMLAVLLLLVVLFSALTVREQHPQGRAAGRSLGHTLLRDPASSGGAILVYARGGVDDLRFVESLRREVERGNRPIARTVIGEPTDLRAALADLDLPAAGPAPVLATIEAYAPLARSVLGDVPGGERVQVATPPTWRWPTFLLIDNLRNVANQITVIAIVAIGMTMVIISGGIDLSVGSLIALSAVASAGIIERSGGGAAGGATIALACAAGMALCGLFGLASGFFVTRFAVPPFIATLAVMQVASGLAYILSKGRPIYQLPDSVVVLGRGTLPGAGIPYSVLLMAVLFIAAHALMTKTVIGRHIYAVGGNPEAARLAGVRVPRTLHFVYAVTGILAGLGGIITASQLKSGAPTYGLMYELYVIAAVVVGGTSLNGGEGRVLGTLIGAFIIAVIQNGMNLTNVESYTQKIVLGVVILSAVLLDRVKHQGLLRLARRRSAAKEAS